MDFYHETWFHLKLYCWASQKHYKGKFPHLIDPVRGFEKKFNRNGWPFYLIADGEGTVVFHKTTLIRGDRREILSILDAVAPEKAKKTAEYKGVVYPEKIIKRKCNHYLNL